MDNAFYVLLLPVPDAKTTVDAEATAAAATLGLQWCCDGLWLRRYPGMSMLRQNNKLITSWCSEIIER